MTFPKRTLEKYSDEHYVIKKNQLLLSALPLLLLAAVVGASVPLPLDPLKAAAHIHELQFENDQVRVIMQTIRKGETMPLHSHPNRVMVYLQTCGWLESDGNGGEQMQLFNIGDAVWAPAETHGGKTATVVQECKVLEIELQ